MVSINASGNIIVDIDKYKKKTDICKSEIETILLNKHDNVMDIDKFIEQEIQFRLGDFYNKAFEIPRTLNGKPFLGNNYFYILYNNKIIRRPNFRKDHGGLKLLLKGSMFHRNLPLNVPVLVFFGDATGVYDREFPIFNFNRHVSVTKQCLVFWDRIFNLENTYHVEDNISWDNKLDKVIWRGSATGNNFKYSLHGKLISKKRNLFSNYLKTEKTITNEDLFRFSRYNFCQKFKNNSLVDVGFTKDTIDLVKDERKKNMPDDNLNLDKFFTEIIKSKKKITEMLEYKYQLALEGNDWATSLIWQLGANCVVLMPPITFHNIYTSQLKPWIHYVPIKADFSDLVEIIEFMRENDELSKNISKNASVYISRFGNEDLQNKINQGIISKYIDNFTNIEEIREICKNN